MCRFFLLFSKNRSKSLFLQNKSDDVKGLVSDINDVIIVFLRSESSNGRYRALRRRIVDNGRPSVFLSTRQ